MAEPTRNESPAKPPRPNYRENEWAEEPGSGISVGQQAKDVAGHIAEQARDLATTGVARQAEKSADDIGDVARALHETSQRLEGNSVSPLVDKVADQLERVSDFVRNADFREVKDGIETFARREPLLFLGGAFVLGMIGARFLKSSGERSMSEFDEGARARGMSEEISPQPYETPSP